MAIGLLVKDTHDARRKRIRGEKVMNWKREGQQ
jgi:hypothetical protein